MNSLFVVVVTPLLLLQTPPSAENSLFDGQWRVTTVAGDRDAVLSTHALRPKDWIAGSVWMFSKGTMTREGERFIHRPPPRPPVTDKDVERAAKGLESRLGKKRALELARTFQRSSQLYAQERRPGPGVEKHDMSYRFHIDPKQSPMQIELLVVMQMPKVEYKPGGEKKDVVISEKREVVFSKHLGIYKQEGETKILICFAAPRHPRPAQFKVTDQKQQVLLRLEKR